VRIEDMPSTTEPPLPGASEAAVEADSPAEPSIYEQPLVSDQPADTPAATPAAVEPNQPPTQQFAQAWDTAWNQVTSGNWTQALQMLSGYYGDARVTGEERQRLVDLLDPLAGKVIYSREHLLEPPYQVRPGETLAQIAAQYQVPATLLQKINGITDPQNMPPGTVLKVVRGPFRAEVTLQKDELVLFLGDHYAGRFAISVGNDPTPNAGPRAVEEKQEGREYFAPDGSRVAAGAPDNPYGNWWIGLGGDICIHGSAQTTPAHGGLGCISLGSADAADIYGILSVGSKVLIR
jgi:lipoprotein-anchoring transpeptidase ErfK/SrfK